MKSKISIKKVICLIAVIALAMTAFAGCGGSSKPASSGSENTSSSNSGSNSSGSSSSSTGKTYNIGINQQLEHVALDQATKGFKDALTELLGDRVKFDVKNAQGEQANCATIASGFVAQNVDLILANATGALQATSAATNQIPIVGTSITDYATALDISNWNGKTGTNVTGTSDLAPLKDQAAMIKELLPNVKKVGLLYCSAEPNSMYQIKSIKGYLTDLGIASEEYAAADSNEIQSVVSNAISSCDAIYIPTDNTMASATETINNVTLPAKIPVIAGEEGIARGCGLATLSISYYDIGKAAGKMAYEILENGKKPGDMEIQYAEFVQKLYNADIAKELGITVPSDYKALEESK